MPSKSSLLAGAVSVIASVWLAASPVAAQTLAGKNVDMLIGLGTGGNYDLWARTVAKHIGRHLPGNPTVLPKNMPGAGSFLMANHLYTIAPKDGTVMGLIARDAVVGAFTGAEGARFDPSKMSWVGSPTRETSVCIANASAPVKTFEDLKKTELKIGDTGPGTGTYTYPRALNALFGTKFKVISGYPSSSDVFLAMERGEVDGICESLDSVNQRRPEWLPNKKVSILVQGGLRPNEHLAGVPFVLDLAPDEDTKTALRFLYVGQELGRPFLAPPDLPADRLKMLRDAFDATMKDPLFLAEAEKLKFDIEPTEGAALEKLVKDLYKTPKPIIDKVAAITK